MLLDHCALVSSLLPTEQRLVRVRACEVVCVWVYCLQCGERLVDVEPYHQVLAGVAIGSLHQGSASREGNK